MLESVAPHGFAYRDGLMSPAQETGLVGYSVTLRTVRGN